MTKESRKEILSAVAFGLAVNIFLAAIKISFGLWGNAQALFSDGLNSLSDVFISIMILAVLKLATKKPDHDHPYGHEKYEGLAYFVLGIIFFVTAIVIGINAITSIINYMNNPNVDAPHIFTVIISLLSLVVKVILFKYYLRISKKYKSPTLKADSKNHLLDAWATLFSLIGLTLAQFNFIIFDYIASFIIGLFILRLAVQILKDSISYLTDQAPSEEEIKSIFEVILSIDGVLKVDDLKVRKHMTQRYVDVEIGVKSNITLEVAHKIAETVHHKVEFEFPDVIHCMVHVNPHKSISA
ncbi:MAG: cation diffusion facilitator family transporter [Acholeplasmataceae bacterium]|nr:cation diffusion facilitator family transporter [Acholeplasmataceae bacterium]